MPQRTVNSSKVISKKGTKRIILPLDLASYSRLIADAKAFRDYVDEMSQRHPELFPTEIGQGYKLHGMMPPSKKMPQVQLRRIQLKARDEQGQYQVYTIAPCDLLPYMTGQVSEVEKALFLRRFGVPFWALSYVFGRNDSYWYRLYVAFGRNDLVGTTIKQAQNLPEDLVADEKHTHFHGETVYIATTVAQDCIVGASLALNADERGLTEAYAHFKAEAQTLAPTYTPHTINTDGWSATQLAWQSLFPSIIILQCFLHAFLKIRAGAKRLGQTFTEITHQVWDIYHAPTRAGFYDKISTLHQWTTAHSASLPLPVQTALHKLCAKADHFALAFDYPHAHRTSNMLDRHMEPMARWLTSSRYFHGHLLSAELQTRSWALFHNFGPYCPRSKVSSSYHSPAHKLNGFVYRDNWLENLLVSTSCRAFHLSNKKRQN